MTIHVNIGEAKTRLSELVAAVERGEDVVLNKAGVPTARLIAFADRREVDADEIVARRRRALGLYRHLAPDDIPMVRDLKPTAGEREEGYRRKFGAAD